MIPRDVCHIRLKEMELQAERIMDPSLKTRPIAIISSSNPNGTVVSLSSEAIEEGVTYGMKVSIVRKMNHQVQLLPYNKSLYNRVNQYAYGIMSTYTPVVEPESLGKFYLDMNGMHSVYSNINNIGLSIIQKIQDKTSIMGTIGISVNKLISQVVTSVVPDIIYKVENGEETRFLGPLSPSVLPIVKEKSVYRLLKFLWVDQVSHIQLMAKHVEEFKILFGLFALQLDREARGKDSSVVKPYCFQDHIIEQTVLPEDTNDINSLYAVVKWLAHNLAFKLRIRWQVPHKLKLEIHYSDGYKMSHTGHIKTIDDASVTSACKRLFKIANRRRNRIRSILVDAKDLGPYIYQENLFLTPDSQSMAISNVLDIIRKKYGFQALQTADIFDALIKK